MGQQAAKISKIVSQRWNAEHRAFKVLDQNEIRPSVAPRYTSSLREPASEPVRPEDVERQQQKNKFLGEMLKGANVNPDKIGEIVSKTRPLPHNTDIVEETEFGYLEPVEPIMGRCSIKQALNFLTEHQRSPEQNSHDVLAKQYSINIEDMRNITHYFQMFNVDFPKKPVEIEVKKKPIILVKPDYERLGRGVVGGALSGREGIGPQKALPSEGIDTDQKHFR